MQALAIVVADSARARLFTFKRESDQDPAPVLRDRVDLISPERRMHDGELFTADDHRDAHTDERDRRFAQQVMERTAALCAQAACTRVALVASPRFLGHLRHHAAALRGLDVEEVARDLTREPTPKLREHLGELGLLPGRAVTADRGPIRAR